MTPLDRLLKAKAVRLEKIAAHLEARDPATRLAELVLLGRRQQARLFEAAAGQRPISLDDLVPRTVADLVEVAHRGSNALPLFRRFAKVFCRPDPGAPRGQSELWGYNRTSKLLQTTAGPGYFVVYPERRGELLIDYTRLPARRILGWPPILPNEARLGRMVWAGMQDVLRGVSRHVTIGRARRKGHWLDQWFVLSREDL